MKYLIIMFLFVISANYSLSMDSNKLKTQSGDFLLDSINIVLANNELKNVIDQYVDECLTPKDNYVICLQLKVVEDIYIIQIGPNVLNANLIYSRPPISVVSYDNKALLVYNGFEEFFYFPEKYKDDLAKKYFLEQFIGYKNTGMFPEIKNEDISWKVKIRDDNVISLQKFVLDPIYWR